MTAFRTLVALVAFAAGLQTAQAQTTQDWPNRPVRLIVGFGAGSASDILARLIGEWLSERLGQQFIIDNRPGAGSNPATEAAVKAPPDGHVLLLCGVTNAIKSRPLTGSVTARSTVRAVSSAAETPSSSTRKPRILT